MTLTEQILSLLRETPGMKYSVQEINDCLERADTKGSRDSVSNTLVILQRAGLVLRARAEDWEREYIKQAPYLYWVQA